MNWPRTFWTTSSIRWRAVMNEALPHLPSLSSTFFVMRTTCASLPYSHAPSRWWWRR